MYVTGQSPGEYEGLESTTPSPSISGGNVAAERLYRISGTPAPIFPVPGLA